MIMDSLGDTNSVLNRHFYVNHLNNSVNHMTIILRKVSLHCFSWHGQDKKWVGGCLRFYISQVGSFSPTKSFQMSTDSFHLWATQWQAMKMTFRHNFSVIIILYSFHAGSECWWFALIAAHVLSVVELIHKKPRGSWVTMVNLNFQAERSCTVWLKRLVGNEWAIEAASSTCCSLIWLKRHNQSQTGIAKLTLWTKLLNHKLCW